MGRIRSKMNVFDNLSKNKHFYMKLTFHNSFNVFLKNSHDTKAGNF